MTKETSLSSYKSSSRRKLVQTWHGLWVSEGKHRSKSFSEKRHGLIPCFAKACAYQEAKILTLNANGADYSPTHGKRRTQGAP